MLRLQARLAMFGLMLAACVTSRPPAKVPPSADALRLAYRISITAEAVRVEMEVRGRPGARIPFRVMGHLGAGRDFRIVSDVTAREPEGPSVPLSTPTPHVWEGAMPPNGTLKLSYRVRTDAEAHGLSLREPGFGEMPKQDERHVFLPGALVLLSPTGPDAVVEGPIPVEWRVPDGWEVLTPFGAEAPDLTALLDNYLAAGRFSRVTTEAPGGLRLDVAWFGEGDVARSALPEMLSRVFGATVGLMGGRAPTPRYVVLLRPDFPSGVAQGTPKEGSIQVHLPHDVPLERAHLFRAPGGPVLARILAHEYLHNWGRVRGADLADASEPEEGGEMRWFGEGFVHYLSHLALLRSGEMDLDAFQAALGREYSAVRQNAWYGRASLTEASARFFEDGEARAFSYGAGMLVAFLCDLELRDRGHGPLERFLDRMPPGENVPSAGQWLERWAGATGSPEPVATWLRDRAPLPFLEAVQRAGAVLHAKEDSPLGRLRQ